MPRFFNFFSDSKDEVRISIKSPREIAIIRDNGKRLSEIFSILQEELKVGMSTWDIDRRIEELIVNHHKAEAAFKGYQGFPASACLSVNDEVVHGIPDKKHILKEGDIISIDIGLKKDGYVADSAFTFPIGQISSEAQRLLKITQESLWEGIKNAKVGNRLFDISRAIQIYVENAGYSVVRKLVGHGVGSNVHEDPQIPNYVPKRGYNPRLEAGMVLAIEPMVNAGGYDVKTLSNKWTVVTKDGSLSAHFEHTVAVMNGEPQILTLP